MNHENNILQELQGIAPLLINAQHLFCYKVPNNYFDTVAQTILKNIQHSEANTNQVFNELENIAPLLNNISKQPVFSIPAEYFKNTPVYSETKNSKVVLLQKKYVQWVNYAVAAIFIGVLSIGVVKYLKKSNAPINFKEQVANASEEEIHQYLEAQSSIDYSVVSPENEELNNIPSFEEASDEEMNYYLEQQLNVNNKNS